MDKTLTDSLYGGDYGAMRSVGGGTDGTDGTLIAFIVIAALIGGEMRAARWSVASPQFSWEVRLFPAAARTAHATESSGVLPGAVRVILSAISVFRPAPH